MLDFNSIDAETALEFYDGTRFPISVLPITMRSDLPDYRYVVAGEAFSNADRLGEPQLVQALINHEPTTRGLSRASVLRVFLLSSCGSTAKAFQLSSLAA